MFAEFLARKNSLTNTLFWDFLYILNLILQHLNTIFLSYFHVYWVFLYVLLNVDTQVMSYLGECPIKALTDVSIGELYGIRAPSQIHVARGNQLNLVPGEEFARVLLVDKESQL